MKEKKKKAVDVVTHACRCFLPEIRTTVQRKSVCRSVFEERGWHAFDKLVSELLQLEKEHHPFCCVPVSIHVAVYVCVCVCC